MVAFPNNLMHSSNSLKIPAALSLDMIALQFKMINRMKSVSIVQEL